MNSDRVTFIHASGVLVDHQPGDVVSTDDDKLRPTLLDAACVAWQRIVQACVTHEVHFLLLSGDTFAEADRSLQARTAIRSGMVFLEEAGVQVVVIPGNSDPVSAWQAIPGLPDNVTIFDPHVDEPTAVMRHGEVVASIQACLQASPQARPSVSGIHEPVTHSRIAPFRVGIAPAFTADGLPPSQEQVEQWLPHCPVDYLALPRPFRRIQVAQPDRTAHCPGPAVALTGSDIGLQGASLVRVEANNAISISLLPVSPIRRERLHIRVDHTSTWDLLIQCMRQLIGDLKSLDEVEALLIDWRIKGSGSLHETLHTAASEAELFELLEIDGSMESDRVMSHQLTLAPPDPSPTSDADDESDLDTEDDTQVHPVLAGFLERLDRESSVVRAVMRRHDTGSGEPATPWFERLESLATRVNHTAVATAARTHGTEWFGETPDDEQSLD